FEELRSLRADDNHGDGTLLLYSIPGTDRFPPTHGPPRPSRFQRRRVVVHPLPVLDTIHRLLHSSFGPVHLRFEGPSKDYSRALAPLSRSGPATRCLSRCGRGPQPTQACTIGNTPLAHDPAAR